MQARDSCYSFLTAKERDIETGLDYFIHRYYSASQGRFTSVDPENAGAEIEDPQSWNGYSYTRNTPTVLTDPDGRTFKICYKDGGCQEVSDEQFDQIKTDATKLGSVFKNGKIYNQDGNGNLVVTATYERTAFDEMLFSTAPFEISKRVAPIPKATAAFAGTAFVIGASGGAAAYFLAPATSSVTTLGLGATRTVASPFLRVLLSEFEKEIVSSGAQGMGERVLAIERVLGKRGLDALGRLTAEGVEIESKKEIVKVAYDGTVRVISKATGELIKIIK